MLLGIILLLIFSCLLLDVGGERFLISPKGVNREVVAFCSFENKRCAWLVFLGLYIFVHDVFREFNFNDELVALRLYLETREMDDVDVVSALKQEFVLCWRSIVAFAANLRFSLDSPAQEQTCTCDLGTYLNLLFEDRLEFLAQFHKEIPISWPWRHNHIAQDKQFNIVLM